MIYFKLRTGEQKILSIPGTFARQADTGADLDQAMANPIIDPIGLNIRIASQNPCFVVEKTWYSAEQLASQNHDSFIVGGLTCCAAVLSYDGASNLVNVGHAQGGFINDSQLAYIKSLAIAGASSILFTRRRFFRPAAPVRMRATKTKFPVWSTQPGTAGST